MCHIIVIKLEKNFKICNNQIYLDINLLQFSDVISLHAYFNVIEFYGAQTIWVIFPSLRPIS